MKPEDNTEDAEGDPRLKKLIDELIASEIRPKEGFHLHMWLSSHADIHTLDQLIEKAVGTLSHAEQVKACANLERCASKISSQLSYLNQVSALDQAMSETYRQLKMSCSPDLPRAGEDDWASLRSRISADAALLEVIANWTQATLESRGGTKGRKSNEWRNRLLTELVDRVGKFFGKSHEATSALAHGIWNIYFPDEDIGEPESVGKIAARERRRKKLRGQNAA